MFKPTLTPRTGALTLTRLIPSQHPRSYSAPGDNTISPSKQKYIPTSGTYPKGFLAGSAHVGVKPSNTRFDDLALIASTTPCTAAAVFTTNRFQAAPVTVSREVLKERNGEGVWGVVINSGCANAVTGRGGIEDARVMGEEADRCLREARGEKEGDGRGLGSLVMSTGVIGQRLPIQKIISQISPLTSTLGQTHDHWLRTSRAICTTDTFPKLISQTFTLPTWPDTTFSMAGMTKGAGMIHPNMATLLGVIATDAAVAPSALQSALKEAVAKSFNSISVDGDTSTNDTVAVLANGAAVADSTSHSYSSTSTTSSHKDSDTNAITSPEHPSYPSLLKALTTLCTSLSQLIIRDGEGATKFVTIRVTGCPDRASGHKIASTIARSPLVKTALYGRDANWGRILCAIGYTPELPEGTVIPEKTSVSFVPVRVAEAVGGWVGSAPKGGEGVKETTQEKSGELKLLVNGEPQVVDEARAAELLKEEDVEILVRLRPEGEGDGGEEVVFWTCDFSHEYVTINGDYRT